MATKSRLIDANDLTDRLNHTTMVAYPNLFPGLLAAVEIVDDSPTVDAVEVVHGQWEDGVCTACDFDIRELIDGESDFRNWVWEGLPYCPNCGAKMDGDGNG